MDFITVIYSNVNLDYIGVTNGMNGNQVLAAINTAVNSMSPAPVYTGYSLGCMRDSYTIDTTQEFAEATAALLCNLTSTVTTFIGTTYASDKGTFTTAISNLQNPALTYAPFSITSADNITTVYGKMFTGFTAMTASIDPSSANWSSIGAGSQSTIVDAFNAIIAYELTQDTAIAACEPAIGTFNNSANCLSGGTTDSAGTTISELISYTCGLPNYDSGAITWNCISPGGTLNSDIQAISNIIASLVGSSFPSVDTSLSITSLGPCSGNSLAINTDWAGLYKVLVDGSDTTPDNLLAKLYAGNDISLSVRNSGGNEQVVITNTAPANGEVAVNVSDTSKDFLQAKIPSTMGDWGLGIMASPSPDNSQLLLKPQVINPDTFIGNFLSYISTNPTLLAQLCAINAQCQGCTCAVPTDLVVALTEGGYNLSWVVGASSLSQTVQYRQRGSVDWISNVNITAPNPQTNTATTANVSGLTVNTVYQFQVVNNCSGVSNNSNVYESITYMCQTPTIVVNCVDGSGVISVNQTPMLTVDTITYQLINSSLVVVDTQIGTGINPQVTFTPQPNDTYSITWFYTSTINGTSLSSTDPSQLNALCTATGVVISC